MIDLIRFLRHPIMGILVVQAVDAYGSTQDEEIAVPLTIDPTNSNHPPPSPSKQTTMWKVVCILGLAAATLVSSAVLFVSRREASAVLRAAIRNDEAFLLHRKDGTCVAQSGGWPANTVTTDNNEMALSGPYSTCFVFQSGAAKTDYCWSRSYINKDGDWKPYKPKGYGSGGWTESQSKKFGESGDCNGKGYYSGYKANYCGPSCNEFE